MQGNNYSSPKGEKKEGNENGSIPKKNEEEEDAMTFEETTKIAYLLRYENMVKHQEAEDMAVREHLTPIFEKLSSGKSTLSFTEMYHWGQVLETSSPEQECILTDSQLMMILDTFQSHPSNNNNNKDDEEDGWTLTDFTFCYKFIILGMQTLQHLSMEDEDTRQQFKDTFFQMLQDYKQQQQQQQLSSEEEEEDNPETMRKLLTLKDGQMVKLISNMMEEEEESLSVAPMSFTSRDSILDDEDNDDDDDEVEQSAVHIRPRRTRRRQPKSHEWMKQQQGETNTNNYRNSSISRKGIYFFNFCLVFIIVIGILMYVIDTIPTIHNDLDTILHSLKSSSSKIQSSIIPTSSMQIMPPPPPQQQQPKGEEEVWTSHDWNALKKDLTRSMEQSQKELMEARSQIQSLVSVLADLQKTNKDEQVPEKPQQTSSLTKKVIPLVVSTVIGAAIMYAIQPLLLPSSAIISRGGQVAISSPQSIRFLGKIRFLWSKFCQLTSRTILAMLQQPQNKFHSIIV